VFLACNFGSGADLVPITRADDACLKEIKLSSTVHLALYKLEFGDLPFGLSVGPRR
jgi:hypothetical protein